MKKTVRTMGRLLKAARFRDVVRYKSVYLGSDAGKLGAAPIDVSVKIPGPLSMNITPQNRPDLFMPHKPFGLTDTTASLPADWNKTVREYKSVKVKDLKGLMKMLTALHD